MNALLVLTLVISYLSLFFAFLWITTLYFEEKVLHKPPKKLRKKPFVSIILPVYNEEEIVAQAIEQLLKLDYPKNKLEIIVVANGCTDRTAEVVRKFKQVRLIETPVAGKARAQNIGLQKARGEIVIISDADDVRIQRDALYRILPYFEDPQVAEVASTIKIASPKNLLEKIQHYEFLISGFIRRLMHALGVLFIPPGAFNAYRKSTLKKLGGFDEKTLTEDLEIATRLLKHGYKVISDLDTHVDVRAARSLAGFHSQRLRWYRGFIEVMAKHKDMLFHKKYGFLAIFLSFMVGIPIILGIIFGATILKILSALASMAFILSFADLKLLASNLVPEGLLTLNVFIVVPTLTVLAISAYTLNKANYHLRERWSYPFAIVVYFFFYPFVLTFYWFLAMFLHVVGAKKRWRGSARW